MINREALSTKEEAALMSGNFTELTRTQVENLALKLNRNKLRLLESQYLLDIRRQDAEATADILRMSTLIFALALVADIIYKIV